MLKNIKDKLTKYFSKLTKYFPKLTEYFSKLTQYFLKGKKPQVLGLVLIVVLTATIFSSRKTITVNIDGKESKIVTYKGTVQGALHDSNIVLDDKDKVEPGINDKLKDEETIKIKRAIDINVQVDGKELAIKSSEDNVESMLKQEGIELKDEDRITPSSDSSLEEGMKIEIVRVEVKDIVENKEIAFDVNVKKDDTLANTYSKVTQEGQNGQKEITTRVVYENGKEIDRKVVKEVVTKEPVAKELVQGTLQTVALSRGGEASYSKSIICTATAYNDSGRTASGMTTSRNPGGYSTVAVDPSVIPMGSKLYIPGYGYAIAADTGGAIKGNKVDLYVSSSAEAYAWVEPGTLIRDRYLTRIGCGERRAIGRIRKAGLPGSESD